MNIYEKIVKIMENLSDTNSTQILEELKVLLLETPSVWNDEDSYTDGFEEGRSEGFITGYAQGYKDGLLNLDS